MWSCKLLWTKWQLNIYNLLFSYILLDPCAGNKRLMHRECSMGNITIDPSDKENAGPYLCAPGTSRQQTDAHREFNHISVTVFFLLRDVTTLFCFHSEVITGMSCLPTFLKTIWQLEFPPIDFCLRTGRAVMDGCGDAPWQTDKLKACPIPFWRKWNMFNLARFGCIR